MTNVLTFTSVAIGSILTGTSRVVSLRRGSSVKCASCRMVLRTVAHPAWGGDADEIGTTCK